ncbi:MAG TPA: YbhB/YbcL family Raf kinase inhibitor-like protein [Steroidobacteraceae bacterium]
MRTETIDARAARFWAGVTVLASALVGGAGSAPATAEDTPKTAREANGPFTLTSADIAEGRTIPDRQVFNSFGCKGANVSPALSWRNPPAGTQSFALLVYDPDAPTGSGWWHWIVYDIPASVTSLPAGAGEAGKHLLPAGAMQGRTDYGTVGYGGPCPPPGAPHHYHFQLFALKVAKLEVPKDATAALIGFNVHANSLGKAQIVALYGR